MTNTLHRALGATTAAAIAALTLGAFAPATATSLAVEVIPTGSSATPTDVRFDLTLRVRDVGPVSLSVLPLQAADTTPVQHAVTAVCTPASLPGLGTYDVTCEGSAASTRPLAPGEYDLTGLLLVKRDTDGHVLSDTYLTHRLLVVDTPVAPEEPVTPVAPAEPPSATDEAPTDEAPENSAPTGPGGEAPVEPDPVDIPPEESAADGDPGTPAIPSPPVETPADVSGPTDTRPTAGDPGDTVALTIDAGGIYEPGNTDALTTDVPLSQPLLWTAACIAAGAALLCALLKRPQSR